MTDLTEQWKKGELPDGFYYVENNNGVIGMLYWSEIAGWYNIKEIKAKVPTYQEYLESESHCAVYSDMNRWLKQDCKTLAQTLLKVSPEHREWLETNFKEYL